MILHACICSCIVVMAIQHSKKMNIRQVNRYIEITMSFPLTRIEISEEKIFTPRKKLKF